MSAPNGPRETKTSSNAPTPLACAETAQSKMSAPVSQDVDSGQSNTSSSASQTMRNSMSAGRGQWSGGSNGSSQGRTQTTTPGFVWGGCGLVAPPPPLLAPPPPLVSPPPPRNHGPVPVPGPFGSGRGWEKRDAEAFRQAATERPLKSPRLSQQHELSSQIDILKEANSLKPQKPTDDSDDTTSIMIQRKSARGVEIDLKVNPNTDEGREMLLDAARRAGQQNGNVDILVSMRPVKGTDDREKH